MLLCKRVLKASFKIAIYLFWEQNIDFLGMCLYFSWSHKSYQEVLKLLYLHDFLQRKEIQVLLCWIVDVSEINEGRTKFNHINPLQLSRREIFITSLSVFLKNPTTYEELKFTNLVSEFASYLNTKRKDFAVTHQMILFGIQVKFTVPRLLFSDTVYLHNTS